MRSIVSKGVLTASLTAATITFITFAADWKPVTAYSVGTCSTEISVDRATWVRDNDRVSAWVKRGNKPSRSACSGLKYKKAVALVRYDCTEAKWCVTHISAYSWSGEPLVSTPLTCEWHGVVPNTVTEKELNFACGDAKSYIGL
jgi:hypothetical protein